MAAKLLNIEIGDRVSKVCRTVRRGKTCQIEESFLFCTPDGAVSDGFINDPAALAAALQGELDAHHVAGAGEVIFTLSSGRVATRDVTLPPVKDNRIQALIETNAADYFPVDMSNYQVSYALLDRRKGPDGGELQVLVMAAPITLVQTYVALADACGLKIRSMDYSGNSQFQALRGLKQDGVTMYVNVGCSSSYATFISNGEFLLQRTFTFGGTELINAYMTSNGRGPERYLDTLRELTAAVPDGVAEQDVADTMERLIGSIIRSCDYFASSQEAAVDRIVLMGLCSRLPYLRDLVANGSGVETVNLDEVPGVERLANSTESASDYISCLGSTIASVDLRPEDYKNRKRGSGKDKAKTDSITGGVVICAVCVAASVILCVVSVLGYFSEQKRLTAMQDRIEELAYVEQVYNTYVAYTANQEGLQIVRDTALGHNAELENFFTELETKMPASILLLSADCGTDGITMDVTVNTYEETANVIQSLRDFQSIDSVQVSEITREPDNAGITRASFTVSCLYPVPAEEGTDAAAAGTEG